MGHRSEIRVGTYPDGARPLRRGALSRCTPRLYVWGGSKSASAVGRVFCIREKRETTTNFLDLSLLWLQTLSILRRNGALI